MEFVGNKIAHEHIYWDQASLLAQIGLLDTNNLPVKGIEESRKLQELVTGSSTQWIVQEYDIGPGYYIVKSKALTCTIQITDIQRPEEKSDFRNYTVAIERRNQTGK